MLTLTKDQRNEKKLIIILRHLMKDTLLNKKVKMFKHLK
jgi:hypothetical protein